MFDLHSKTQFNVGVCWPNLYPEEASCLRSGGRPLAPRRLEYASMAKVLLIEDDRETAGEITAELVERGFDVDWAATGIEGLDKARAGEADR